MPTTSQREEVVNRVRSLAAQQADVDSAEVTESTHLFNDLNYDSLDAVEFSMLLEDEFDIHIPDEQAESVKTVGDAVRLLVQSRERQRGA